MRMSLGAYLWLRFLYASFLSNPSSVSDQRIMFQQPPHSMGSIPNRKQSHQHHESKKWVRLPANQRCLECYPVRRPFLETAFGKIPPEIRANIFKDVLTLGSIFPLKDGISVPMTKTKHNISQSGSKTKFSIGPAGPVSCLALLQSCRQIYHESSLLFYSINTFYLSNPQDMLSFLRHLGPVRCGELRSLHVEELLAKAPRYSQKDLDYLRSVGNISDDVIASIAATRSDEIHPEAKKAIQLLNKVGNLRKIFLNVRPSYVLEYINFCTQIPGFRNREIVFAAPTCWTVMAPSKSASKSTSWTPPWFLTFLEDVGEISFGKKPCFPYWRGNEKYRVEVDILHALQEGRIHNDAGMDYDRSVDGET